MNKNLEKINLALKVKGIETTNDPIKMISFITEILAEELDKRDKQMERLLKVLCSVIGIENVEKLINGK